MKFRNGQSKQQINKKPLHSLSFSNQTLLNEMYDRVCNKQAITSDEFQSVKPLLSYLSISGQTSQVEQKLMSPHFQQNLVGKGEPIIIDNQCKVKKYSMQQRVKTDMNQLEWLGDEQLQNLQLENDNLRKKLMKCEKRIISLQSYESEVEYLKKISFLQHNQIEKLRLMLKNVQLEKVEQGFNHFRRTESKSKSLKQTKNDKNAIIVYDTNESLEAVQQKKAKCAHKESGCKKDKENNYHNYRSHSAFFQSKSKQPYDKLVSKGIGNDHKCSKLKNRKALVKLE